MNLKNKLNYLKIELAKQNKNYQPSSFWKTNIIKFFGIFEKYGLVILDLIV